MDPVAIRATADSVDIPAIVVQGLVVTQAILELAVIQVSVGVPATVDLAESQVILATQARVYPGIVDIAERVGTVVSAVSVVTPVPESLVIPASVVYLVTPAIAGSLDTVGIPAVACRAIPDSLARAAIPDSLARADTQGIAACLDIQDRA